MQDLVRSYAANADLIQKFILSTLGNVSLKTLNVQLIERLYKTFPSLELLYMSDEGFVQNSPNICTITLLRPCSLASYIALSAWLKISS